MKSVGDREKKQAQNIIDHILYNCALSSLKERGIINDFDIETIENDDTMICNIRVKPVIAINDIKINFEIDA